MCCSRKLWFVSKVCPIVLPFLLFCVCPYGFGGNTFGTQKDISSGCDMFIDETVLPRFDSCCSEWCLNFAIPKEVKIPEKEVWKEYMEVLIDLGNERMVEYATPIFSDFVQEVFSALYAIPDKVLNQKIRVKYEDREYRYSRRDCLFYLLIGAATEFSNTAKS